MELDDEHYPKEKRGAQSIKPTTNLRTLRNQTARIRDPIVKKQFEIVQEELYKTEPDIVKIMKTDMSIKDKTELTQLYELYKSLPFSEEQINIRNKINQLYDNAITKYKEYSKFSATQHDYFESQIKELETLDFDQLKYKILALDTSLDNKRIIYNMYKRFTEMVITDDEYTRIKKWLMVATNIPYNNIKSICPIQNQIPLLLKKVSDFLNKELYGMQSVKEQILIFLNAKLTNPNFNKCILGLQGPPGVGKTYIMKALSKIIELPFEQISCGGISDSAFFKGHLYTYIGSEPGEIVKRLQNMKYKNGILYFDEFNRISDKNEVVSSLLHIIDPVQNSDFRDYYLSGISIDLSLLWFVFSMNETPVDNALRERIFMIKIPGYNLQEKICILKDYIFPRVLKNANIERSENNERSEGNNESKSANSSNSVSIDSKTCEYLINKYSNGEDGMRHLENCITNVINKISFIKNNQNSKGKMNIDVSFVLNKKIKFPLTITSDLIDSLV